MYCSDFHPRRLLLQVAVTTSMASSPPSVSQDNNGDSSSNSQFDSNAFNVNTRFSPSMAIILVILLSAFFFLAFFSIYMRRCTREQENRARALAAAPAAAAAPAQPQGASPAFLQSLPLIAFSSSKKKGTTMECVVCLTDFEENEPLKQLPRCKHVFHQDCIDMWLFSHTTCPLCRRSVMSDGSRSFRWGGSGSSRLSLGRGSSSVGHFPEIEGANGRQSHGANSNRDDVMRPLPRSHSTGHSLKRAFSRAAVSWSRTSTPLSDLQGGGEAEEGDEEGQVGSGTGGGCLSVAPARQAFQRSRSVTGSSVGGWNMLVSKRGGSKTTSDSEMALATPVGLAAAASSSAARSTFDRLNAAV